MIRIIKATGPVGVYLKIEEGKKMSVAQKLTEYLRLTRTGFEAIPHTKTFTAMETAQAEHVPGRMVAKVVMVKADGKVIMAVLPATHHLDWKRLRELLGTPDVRLMSEQEFEQLFTDCEVGAMPPFGNLYGLPVYADGSLAEDEVIAFNAGTHEDSMKMTFRDYVRLVRPIVGWFADRVN